MAASEGLESDPLDLFDHSLDLFDVKDTCPVPQYTIALEGSIIRVMGISLKDAPFQPGTLDGGPNPSPFNSTAYLYETDVHWHIRLVQKQWLIVALKRIITLYPANAKHTKESYAKDPVIDFIDTLEDVNTTRPVLQRWMEDIPTMLYVIANRYPRDSMLHYERYKAAGLTRHAKLVRKLLRRESANPEDPILPYIRQHVRRMRIQDEAVMRLLDDKFVKAFMAPLTRKQALEAWRQFWTARIGKDVLQYRYTSNIDTMCYMPLPDQ